jgi:hypothetical protein
MRRFLSLLLCACLSLQSVGIVLASEVPCPMEAKLEVFVAAGELSTDALPDCCNDMQTWAETGHLCKQGLDCAGLLVLAFAAPHGITATKLDHARAFTPGPTALTAPPGAPWRPPTGN